LRLSFSCRFIFERYSHFFRAHERPADVSVFGSGVERDQPIAVLTIHLEPISEFLRSLSEYLRALRAFDLYLVVDHKCSCLYASILLSFA
jgi:hypothetical protein